MPTAVRDPLDRPCQTYAWSIAGQQLAESNIDKGDRWTIATVAGEMLRRWDERDQVFRSQFDQLRRPTHVFLQVDSDPETLIERRYYGDDAELVDPEDDNLRGQLIALYDGAGLVKLGPFDFKGNLLTSSRQVADDYTTTPDWSAIESEGSAEDAEITASTLLDSETFTEVRAYDALNRITSVTAPDTSEIRPTYTEGGMLKAVDVRIRGAGSWTSFLSNLEYDARGRRRYVFYGNTTATSHTYDPLTFRLVRLLTTRSPGTTLQDIRYVYEPVGNISSVVDAALQSVFYDDAFVAPDSKYTYDAIYRLIQANGREHASIGDTQVDNNDQPIRNLPLATDPTAVRNYEETYDYDMIGNILEMFHDADSGTATWTRTYTYATTPIPNNQLATTSAPGGPVSYTHDAHGNMIVMPHLSAVTYNAFDQMQSADLGGGGDVYFTYGADGQRVRKVCDETAFVRKERIYLGGFEIYREKLSGVTQLERQTLHVMDGVQRLAMVETKTIASATPVTTPVPMLRFQLGNHLGSAMLELDETGLVISYEEYHPYGTSAYRSSASGVEVSARRYRYTGKERDDETGLYYYGARYYAAWLGRWTSADPIGIGADGPGLYNYTRGS